MKFIYTESANIELDRFQKKQKSVLEELVSQKKYAFGDDEIEITASDIREASERIRPIRLSSRRNTLPIELLSKLYTLMGAVLVVAGVYWSDLMNLLYNNPTQFMLILLGLTVFFLGIMMQMYIKIRSQRTRLMEIEAIKDDELKKTETMIIK